MRLTKAHKAQIAKAVLKPLREKLFSEIEKDILKLEEDYYHSVMDQYLPIIKQLPDGMLNHTNRITGFPLPSPLRRRASELGIQQFCMSKSKPKPCSYSLYEMADDSPYRIKYKEICDRLDAAFDKYLEVEKELWAVMKPCNTDTKLIRMWPASAKIIEEEVTAHFPAPALVRATKLEKLLA